MEFYPQEESATEAQIAELEAALRCCADYVHEHPDYFIGGLKEVSDPFVVTARIELLNDSERGCKSIPKLTVERTDWVIPCDDDGHMNSCAHEFREEMGLD